MKVVYAADLHSDLKQYEELKRLIADARIEVLLLGGDQLAYTRDPQIQVDFIEDVLIDFFKSIAIPVLMINGNVEWTGAVKGYEELERKNLVSLLGTRSTPINALNISGYCYSNPSPFARKDYERRDLKDDTYSSDKPIFTSTEQGDLIERPPHYYLNHLPSMEEDLDKITTSNGIWMMHAPPFGTKLDVIKSGEHVGSKAIRKCIEELQPPLTLHGHIHESPYMTHCWLDRIGATLCINPGRGVDLHAVILEFDREGRLECAEHTIFGKIMIQ